MKTAQWLRRTHLFRADEYICAACRAVCNKSYKLCPSCKSQMTKSKYDPNWVDELEGLFAILGDE